VSASVSTQFFVMHEGRLVFAGPQHELKASQDEYVRKFAR
jgi:ABC-type transporter Mla maintaining outer membrane lipid asymmetry ATPase subunit MlaF